MTCLQAQELMAGAAAGTLPEASREAYGAHLASCPPCRASEDRIRKAWDFLGGLETPPLPLDLADRLKAASSMAPAPVPVPRPPPPPPVRLSAAPLLRWWRPATAVLALAALGWGLHWRFRGVGEAPAAPAGPPRASAYPLQSWSSPGPGTFRITAFPQADLWAAPGARGSASAGDGRLVLEEGMVWGRLLSGERLRVESPGWKVTVTRGSFSAVVNGGAAAFTCHEGFLRVEAGPGFPDGPAAVPERSSVLLLPGRPPVGPRPARAIYPGEPEDEETELARFRPSGLGGGA